MLFWFLPFSAGGFSWCVSGKACVESADFRADFWLGETLEMIMVGQSRGD
jgi:hypothetical protein